MNLVRMNLLPMKLGRTTKKSELVLLSHLKLQITVTMREKCYLRGKGTTFVGDDFVLI